MICFPNAKINIGLRITEKRADGFHNIESCFYPIPWNDILEIVPSKNLSFDAAGITIPGALEDNLCVKAFKLIQQDYQLPPVSIFLQKIIPIGAGMGGGSSDAAFTLKLVNDLFELKITSKQLESYARKLGSDCAFFIKNEPVIALEKGDIFKPSTLKLKGKTLVAVYPNLHISTAQAYEGITPKNSSTNLNEQLNQPITSWNENVVNDFEAPLFVHYPILKKIKGTLQKNGAEYVSMTGSGSTIYGIFNEDINHQLLFKNSFLVKKMVLN